MGGLSFLFIILYLMKSTRLKPKQEKADGFVETSCFSFLSFFSMQKHRPNSPQRQAQISSSSFGENQTSTNLDESLSTTILAPLPIAIQFIDLEFENVDSLDELWKEGDMIGVIGKNSLNQLNLSQASQVVEISPISQIRSAFFLRSYSLDRIFILDDLEESSIPLLFTLQQIFTVKVSSQKVLTSIINRWEAILLQEHQEDILKNMMSKLILKVSLYNGCYWVSFNESKRADNEIYTFPWGKIGLNIKEDKVLIQKVYEELTVSAYFQILEKRKNPHYPEQSNKNFIVNLLQMVRSKISSSFESSSLPSTKMKRYISGNSDEKPSSNSENEDSLFGKQSLSDFDFTMMKYEEEEGIEMVVERKERCYSADISEEFLQQKLNERKNILWEQIYQKY